MHLVFLNHKGNQTKLETLQMETRYSQYYVHYPLRYAYFNTYFYAK